MIQNALFFAASMRRSNPCGRSEKFLELDGIRSEAPVVVITLAISPRRGYFELVSHVLVVKSSMVLLRWGLAFFSPSATEAMHCKP